jgi:hypothetical protein
MRQPLQRVVVPVVPADGVGLMRPEVAVASLVAPAGPPMVLVLPGLPVAGVVPAVAPVVLDASVVPVVPAVLPVGAVLPVVLPELVPDALLDVSVEGVVVAGAGAEVVVGVDISSFLPQAASDRAAAAARIRTDERVRVCLLI